MPGQPLQSISYSCTSGTIAIGVQRVHDRIRAVRPDSAVVTPIEGAMAALRALGCVRISLLMPYLFETAEMVADHFEENGFRLDSISTFDLGGDPGNEPGVLSTASPRQAWPPARLESDALFHLLHRMAHPAGDRRVSSRSLGKPVITSNQALAWSALRQAAVTARAEGLGRLFAEA